MAVDSRFFAGRDHSAAEVAELFADHTPDGVFATAGSDVFVVTAPGGMTVNVGGGRAFVQGFWAKNPATTGVAIPSNSSGSTRIDRIILRLNRTGVVGSQTGNISILRLAGTPGAGAPALTRAAGGTWDLSLAQVTVPNGAVTITTLLDERAVKTVCGFTGQNVMGTNGGFHFFDNSLSLTGFYHNADEQIIVYTNGVARAWFGANGSVGVGGSPLARLHVLGGSILVDGPNGFNIRTVGGATYIVCRLDGAPRLEWGSTTVVSWFFASDFFWTTGANPVGFQILANNSVNIQPALNTIYCDASGNIGIGTTSTVTGYAFFSSKNILLANNGFLAAKEAGGTVRMLFWFNTANEMIVGTSTNLSEYWGLSLSLRTPFGILFSGLSTGAITLQSSTSAIYISPTGTIGFSTTAVIAAGIVMSDKDLYFLTSGRGLYGFNSVSGTNQAMVLSSAGTHLFGSTAAPSTLRGSTIALLAGGTTYGIAIDASGNVSIGLSTVLTRTTVAGVCTVSPSDASPSSRGLIVRYAISSGPQMRMGVDVNGVIGIENSTGSIVFRATQAGECAVANTPPVVGVAFAVSGVAQKTGGGPWDTLSDIRVKRDVRDYDGGLADLLALTPVSFRYTKDAPNVSNFDKEYVGLDASKVRKVRPSMVYSAAFNKDQGDRLVPAGEYDVLDTNELTYMLMNAVKELNAKIARLERKD